MNSSSLPVAWPLVLLKVFDPCDVDPECGFVVVMDFLPVYPVDPKKR